MRIEKKERRHFNTISAETEAHQIYVKGTYVVRTYAGVCTLLIVELSKQKHEIQYRSEKFNMCCALSHCTSHYRFLCSMYISRRIIRNPQPHTLVCELQKLFSFSLSPSLIASLYCVVFAVIIGKVFIVGVHTYVSHIYTCT